MTSLSAALLSELESFQNLVQAFDAAPQNFANATAVATMAGTNTRALEVVFRRHAHLTIDGWLKRARVAKAGQMLRQSKISLSDICAAVGFNDEAALVEAFRTEMHIVPGSYRELDTSRGFVVELPPGFRSEEVLAYQARDPEGRAERRDGQRMWKALSIGSATLVVEVDVQATNAVVRTHAARRLASDIQTEVHRSALRMLGLPSDVAAFEKKHARFVRPRRGLRVPLAPFSFEALCWAIIGQQINVRFASTLRSRMIAAAGEPVEGMRAHPTPAALAALDPATLTSQQFSRSKVSYLQKAANAVVRGELNIEALGRGSAVAAEQALLAQHGVGPWTARYVLMRTGFADAVPIGDSGLATALERMHGLSARPNAAATEELMLKFAPYRSLASMHLWSSLSEISDELVP